MRCGLTLRGEETRSDLVRRSSVMQDTGGTASRTGTRCSRLTATPKPRQPAKGPPPRDAVQTVLQLNTTESNPSLAGGEYWSSAVATKLWAKGDTETITLPIAMSYKTRKKMMKEKYPEGRPERGTLSSAKKARHEAQESFLPSQIRLAPLGPVEKEPTSPLAFGQDMVTGKLPPRVQDKGALDLGTPSGALQLPPLTEGEQYCKRCLHFSRILPVSRLQCYKVTCPVSKRTASCVNRAKSPTKSPTVLPKI